MLVIELKATTLSNVHGVLFKPFCYYYPSTLVFNVRPERLYLEHALSISKELNLIEDIRN